MTVRSGADSQQIVTDHVLAATGCKVDVNRLAFLDKSLLAGIKLYGGAPVLSSVYESTVPGLHFVGIASALSFGPAMRFVYGAKHPAATLAAHIQSAAWRRLRLPLKGAGTASEASRVGVSASPRAGRIRWLVGPHPTRFARRAK
jgi:hypothetical protein